MTDDDVERMRQTTIDLSARVEALMGERDPPMTCVVLALVPILRKAMGIGRHPPSRCRMAIESFATLLQEGLEPDETPAEAPDDVTEIDDAVSELGDEILGLIEGYDKRAALAALCSSLTMLLTETASPRDSMLTAFEAISGALHVALAMADDAGVRH